MLQAAGTALSDFLKVLLFSRQDVCNDVLNMWGSGPALCRTSVLQGMCDLEHNMDTTVCC